MSKFVNGLGKSFLEEGVEFLLGRHLGGGIDRQVYVYAGNPEFVIKVESVVNDRFQNVAEWLLWRDVHECRDINKWLAPCVRISCGGGYLLQERTWPVMMRDLPDKVPVWLSDLKTDNWGRLPSGKIVCHDYGTHLSAHLGAASKRMRKAKWWGDSLEKSL